MSYSRITSPLFRSARQREYRIPSGEAGLGEKVEIRTSCRKRPPPITSRASKITGGIRDYGTGHHKKKLASWDTSFRRRGRQVLLHSRTLDGWVYALHDDSRRKPI